MARYLSAAWFDEVNRAMAAERADAGTGDSGIRVVLAQVVTGGPDGDVHYAVEVAGDGVRVVRGDAPAADVTITQDYATATALHRGELSPQHAILQGRIKVSGNMATLLACQPQLAALDPALAAVRSATTYET